MLTNYFPLASLELRQASARRRLYVVRCLWLTLASLVFLLIVAETVWLAERRGGLPGQGIRVLVPLQVIACVQIFLIQPFLAADAVCGERERGTLDLLTLTRMSSGRVYLDKFACRYLRCATDLFAFYPLLAVCFLIGGISPIVLTCIIVGLLVLAGQVISISLCASAWFRSSLSAIVAAYIAYFVFFLGPPILGELRILSWNELANAFPIPLPLLFTAHLAAYDAPPAQVLSPTALVILPNLAPLLMTAGFLVMGYVGMRVTAVRGAVDPAAVVRRASVRLSESLRRRPGGRSRTTATLPLSERLAANEHQAFPVTSRALPWLQGYRGGLLSSVLKTFAAWSPLLLFWYWLSSALDESDLQAAQVLGICGVTIVWGLILILKVARSAGGDGERQTADSILTLPWTNGEILRQRMFAARRWIIAVSLLAVPTAFPLVFSDSVRVRWVSEEILPESSPLRPQGGDQELGYFYNQTASAWEISAGYGLSVVVCFSLMIGVFLFFVSETALAFSLRSRTVIRAAMKSLVAVVVLLTGPLFMLMAFFFLHRASSAGFGGPPPPLALTALSPLVPFGFLVSHEMLSSHILRELGAFRHFYIPAGIGNLLLLTLLVRWCRVKLTDRILGRLDSPSERSLSDS